MDGYGNAAGQIPQQRLRQPDGCLLTRACVVLMIPLAPGDASRGHRVRQQEPNHRRVTLPFVAGLAAGRAVLPSVSAAFGSGFDVVEHRGRLAAVDARVSQQNPAPLVSRKAAAVISDHPSRTPRSSAAGLPRRWRRPDNAPRW